MGTTVKLPRSLIFPIEIVEINVNVSSKVKRHQQLIRFKYWNRVPDGVPEEGEEVKLVTREFYGTFESPHDGTISKMYISIGDKINDELTPILLVDEGCDHSVQYGGLCALCGRDLENKDYMGYSDVDRAPIAMSHDTAGLTVSLSEAERLESKSTKSLLLSKRLILVVDLDQTVIHASVNSEINEWIDDPESPHHESVKDIHKFYLKKKMANGFEQQSWYFVKVRPHVQKFLEAMAPIYEMHVYTMATRQYALEIAKIIDPDGKYFADRILSRDASGNILHKDLKRLFPVSTQMVTIIDDRGDVWNWSPNLIRVIPYQFWTNTGDINSQFLPTRSGLVTPDQIDGYHAGNKDDTELVFIEKALISLHTRFYEYYDNQKLTSSKHKKASGQTIKQLPDVGKLLPALKSDVFDGCVLLFSGFFPLGIDLDSADVVQWVRSFGAVVLAEFLPSVTHVVARDSGTMKARQAAGRNKMVVSIEWVFDCLEKWKHVDEDKYLLDVRNPIKATDSSNQADREKRENGDVNLDPNIGDTFMRSIQRGDVDWNDIDEELKELLDEEDDEDDEDVEDEDADDDNEDENHENDQSDDDYGKVGEDGFGEGINVDEKNDDIESFDRLKILEENGSKKPETGADETLKRKRAESDVDLGLDEDWD